MKLRQSQSVFRNRRRLKKSVTLSLDVKYFFGPAISFPTDGGVYVRTAVAGLPVDLTPDNLQSMPATVFFPDVGFTPGGLRSFQQLHHVIVDLAGRLFSKCHYVKEYVMTITNHTRRIGELAAQVLKHVDDREYVEAHEDLDYIETRVRLAHRHIDHLQNVTDFCARPAGGS